MTKRLGLRASLGVTGFVVALASALVAAPAAAVTGAGFTTVNEGVDGTGHCKNGNPAINCNIYDGKQYVWLNGGPSVAYVGDGTYFFAVLVPGGQADPNDGTPNAPKNLSDDFDAYTDRTFDVNGGTVTYGGPHDFDSNKIRLMPYADTTNNGGVYIMAICSLTGGYPVDPSDCKYDAFKVQAAEVVPPADDLSVSKDAIPSFTRSFTWDIEKDADKTEVDIASGGSATFNYTVGVSHDAGTDSDWKVSGTIHVFNPNLFAVSGVDVSDAVDNGGTCAVTSGTNVTVPGLGTADLGYSCTYASAPSPLSGNNVATATWPDIGSPNNTADTGPVGFDFGSVSPSLVDDCVSVSDTLGGALGQVCVGDANPTTFTYSHTFSGDPAGTCTNHDNTATFKTNTNGTTGSAGATVKVCVGADLTVSKTASPTFTRTYNWSIAKNVDKTFLDAGGTATYTVTVTETGFVDSAWQLTGNITVSNPNDWEAITANVTDVVDNGGSCAVTGGTNVSIAASGSAVLAYTCTWASAPSNASGTNTATATWDATAASTPNGSASGTAAFAFNTPTTNVNKTITVTDSFGGTLGTATATDTTPYTTRSFQYTRTFTPPANGCQNITNTATIVETGQTASVTVRVCNTGALTMGFWQNKNGQGIIRSYSGLNCQALATWLGQFHPFSNVTAQTTCGSSPSLGATSSTGVVGYIYNIIKAATCGGATCNAMLRAQMLATALNVYFSDAGLGGNRIGAPAPIGGVVIDLTKICAMIDGSGGSTCSGTYQNVSSAFGGATSMTVMNMLLYQNTSDPAADAGAVWYGQVKATQVLAKDAFDAINNQVAVSP